MKPKSEILQIRISGSEKEGFEWAAALAGISFAVFFMSRVYDRWRVSAIS